MTMTAGRPFAARRVEKPWGFELIWAETSAYVGKILHIERGQQLSYQYHRVKDESIHVLVGVLELEVADARGGRRRLNLTAGAGFHVPAGCRHRMTAIETYTAQFIPDRNGNVTLQQDLGGNIRTGSGG